MKRSIYPRIAFTPSREARIYFDGLVSRLTQEEKVTGHITLREAFDRMMRYAKAGEAIVREKEIEINREKLLRRANV